tara:strand:+ start:362 stop:568 length:207 start_codon:yes stop_codon:yes gene_type:complete
MRLTHSGMIGEKEVEMHQVAKFIWAIDIVRHTSEDTKELVEGWEVGDEQKAYALFDSKVNELKEDDEE